MNDEQNEQQRLFDPDNPEQTWRDEGYPDLPLEIPSFEDAVAQADALKDGQPQPVPGVVGAPEPIRCRSAFIVMVDGNNRVSITPNLSTYIQPEREATVYDVILACVALQFDQQAGNVANLAAQNILQGMTQQIAKMQESMKNQKVLDDLLKGVRK
jgi:hypothetical protein